MDPISMIVAAIVAGASEAAKPTAIQAVRDAYAGVKALILRKFGKAATPVQAVEEKPASEARRELLKEELKECGAQSDAEVLRAVEGLIRTLQQHAPQSVAHLTSHVSGGISVQGGTFHAPVNIAGGNATGGGAVVQGAVNTGGGAFAGRDQVINNITLHSVDQVQDLAAVLKSSMAKFTSRPEPDALDAMSVVLDEISKLYQWIDTELTQYLSLGLDSPAEQARERSVLVAFEGGRAQARAAEAKGHCSKIRRIYADRLRGWFGSRLDPSEFGRVDRAFGVLAHSDADMSYVIGRLADWLTEKARETVHLLDAGQADAARATVKRARIDALDMRRKLASTVSAMREIQAELLAAGV